MNFEPEFICGFMVSSKMKRIWAIELELLDAFVKVCHRYGLEYRIMGGTLLGAVRHKGFIPWDNDIDIAMPRKSFNRLLEIGSDAFREPLFFQTPLTERSRFFCTYVKIRNSKSTAASLSEYEKGINCGIFIDVFCLDEMPDNKLVRKIFVRRLCEIAKLQRFCFGSVTDKNMVDRLKHQIQKMVYKYVYHKPNASELFQIYHKIAGKYGGKNCKEVAHLDFGYKNKFVWNKSDWDTSTELDFEEMILAAPAGFDAILHRQYGESTHDYLEFDPNTPYEEFFLIEEISFK